ncbi:MAG: ATP-binding protein [Ferruginibacter sp.]
MNLEIILVFIIVGYLRKTLQLKTFHPHWSRRLIIFAIVAGILVAMQAIFKDQKMIFEWLSHLLLSSLIFLIFFEKEFQPAKSVIYTVLPYLILSVLSDFLEVVIKDFVPDWKGYFNTAKAFAIMWMIAMLFIIRKQRKALELERKKTQEKEQQNQITESLKAALEIQVTERTAELTLQKEELEHALHELKATQVQLIHSEKMASLGELTAGIAHEIQNPLNFVNNFSEVNTELIDELKQEIENGNFEEVKLIAESIKENEQKISHHGKRAEGIVKGMLQHSRTSTGIKEPTDINALADEFLRLSYHGLRAKDKTFNATMKTDFDANLQKINVVPQDIGRVILNLLTNAFYAVNEKKKSGPLTPEGGTKTGSNMSATTYEPTVTVTTRRLGSPSGAGGLGGLSITVTDNGNGIPKKALDKIFQPFFTTKPTGQGTGLGLSMSYDIITKGHNGELKVETEEGKGTSFIIILPL